MRTLDDIQIHFKEGFQPQTDHQGDHDHTVLAGLKAGRSPKRKDEGFYSGPGPSLLMVLEEMLNLALGGSGDQEPCF